MGLVFQTHQTAGAIMGGRVVRCRYVGIHAQCINTVFDYVFVQPPLRDEQSTHQSHRKHQPGEL